MTRTSRLLNRVFKNEERFVDQHNSNTLDPLLLLLRMLHHFPFPWRKWVLNICRIQESPFENHHLHYSKIDPQEIVLQLHKRTSTVTARDVSDLIINLIECPIAMCMLSYFVRAESTQFPLQFWEKRQERIEKEIGAALEANPSTIWEQKKSYLWMNIDKDDFTSPCHSMFTRGLRRLRTEFSRHSTTLLIPYYNDLKNVGRTTQHLYNQTRGEENDGTNSTTTGDLLRYYAETGITIGGPMEVRVKWGFNDLQARLYYCLGGEAYFSALYIKPICNRIVEILPSTNPHSRFDTTRLRIISLDEIVVTYDYSAFTTSLSELKYFMYYLAEQLDGITVDVLDVHSGICQIELREYLHHYNERVNSMQEFQLNRILHGVDDYFRQGRSGSLGTQGNIVFSTALHGIHLGEFTRTPFEDSCVGDDALAVVLANVLPMFIQHVNEIGDIHPDKFTCLSRGLTARHHNEQAFKYLKRPLTVDMEGILRTGFLDAFPDLFTALGYETDPFRTADDLTIEDRSRRLVTQWSRFLAIHQEDHVSMSYALEDHLFVLLEMIGIAYDELGIPRTGCIPSQKIGKGDWKMEAPFYAPPCDDMDVFKINWLDLLFLTFRDERVVVPYTTESVIGPEPECLVTLRTRCTLSHPLVQIMEVLKKARIEHIMIDTSFSSEMLVREKDRIFGGKGHVLANVEFFNVPHWFEDSMMYFLEDTGLGDPFEAMSDFNTIISQ